MGNEMAPSARERLIGSHAAPRLAGGRMRLVCSNCRGELTASESELACVACDSRYSVVDGIPVMSDLADDDTGTDYKRRQIEFFDGESAEFEISRPNGQPQLYGWLMAEKFRRSVRDVERQLSGATLLTVCGGSGMDAEFLAAQGASVVASDLSLGAVQRAAERGRRCGLPIQAIVADAEHLPFADRSVDIVYVHDGLHHLSDPMVGVAEMCRVARHCVLITEPVRAAVTAVAVHLRIALEEEDAGNRVERISPREIAAHLRRDGLNVSGLDRYAMFYQHTPGRWMHFFSRTRSFRIARLSLIGFNRTLGRIGNKASICAVRHDRDIDT